MGPKEPSSTVLSLEEEAIIIAFRKHTLLPLDDCLYALQATISHLTRSSLHRCLQRHGISRLPQTDGDKPSTKKFRVYPIGYFHIDIAEVRTGDGKLHLFVAIDRTSKFAYAELHQRADRKTATAFLKALLKAVPYKIHTVLTDNGIQFADLPKNRTGPTALWRGHMFDLLCQQHGIEHRLTKPNHPWTNGQVERMNRTLKEATVKSVPLREPRPAQAAPTGLPDGLQFCQAPQEAARPHALRTHLQSLDRAAKPLQAQSATPHPGTKHLDYPVPPTGANLMFTIAYRNGPPENPKGHLVEGESVYIKNGMIFDVTPTDRS